MPQITANIKSDEDVKKARKLAIDAGKSLRDWAGEIIEAKINTSKEKKKK